jgi:hypothetical protein
MFHTQYSSDFFVAEHYGLRNTTSWWSKDLASGRKMYNFEEVGADVTHKCCSFTRSRSPINEAASQLNDAVRDTTIFARYP